MFGDRCSQCIWTRSTHGVRVAVRGCRTEIGLRLAVALVVAMAVSSLCLAEPTAAISGVVRDAQGVAQMGAMVQVLAGPVNIATAFTDLYGRYRITNLVPGRYEIRASAALFVPAMRANLRLANGARATVNLTLSMLSDPAAWIPAERRRPDEPGDDWGWTMRAAASRPILRMLDNGEVVLVSSSATERPRAVPIEARGAVMGGGGGFGGGGSHDAITLDRAGLDGSEMVLRTDFGSSETVFARGPAMEFDAGYEHHEIFGGATRLVTGYTSHPEMMNANGSYGMQVLRVSSAEQMHFGDAVDLEAGATLLAVKTTASAISSEPFLRISLRAGDNWTVGYHLATSRVVQSFESLDTLDAGVPIATEVGGRLQLEHGLHQELDASRKIGSGVLQAAVYQDTIARPVITGVGVISAADQNIARTGTTLMADTVTDSFELLGPGYTARGVSFLLSEPITPAIWAVVEVQQGAALRTKDGVPTGLPEELAGMRPVSAEALTTALKGRILRSGTKLQASYRWQTDGLMTPVAEYEAFSDSPYLSFYMRQTLRVGRMLPPGLEATVEVTNLLAQGYQPFLSADGRTLFLAQAPRALQAGLSFTF